MEASIGAGDFKAKCLQLLNGIAERREMLVITKRGKPIARVMLVEPISPRIAVASTRLPRQIQGDPADRLITATARHLGATLVTDDHLLLTHGAAGHLKPLKVGR